MPEPRFPIIGVTGKAGAGKDTICNMAVTVLAEHGLDAERVAFAEPIKKICMETYGKAYNIPNTAFLGSQEEKNKELKILPGWTGRTIAQYLGTDSFRHIDNEVWARLGMIKAQELINKGKHAIFFSDLRFHNEANIIHAHGGVVIRAKRDFSDKRENQGIKNHASEMEMDTIEADFVLNNQGRSLLELKHLVKDLLCDLCFLPLTLKQPG